MKRYLTLTIGLLTSIAIVAIVIKENKKNIVYFEGEKYEFTVYDVEDHKIILKYRELSVTIFEEYPWMLPVVVVSGVDVGQIFSDAEIKSAFEISNDEILAAVKGNIEAITSQMKDPQGGYNSDAEIILQSLVAVRFRNQEYLVAEFSTNLVLGTKSTMTVGVVKTEGGWKYMSQTREEEGAGISLLNEIAQAALKKVSEGEFARENISDIH